jgi:glutamate/tyrosine decarboxylase-like PLP-dependent enzyme
VVELVERCCAHARRAAELLEEAGAEVLNEVVLNQVLFRFDSDERTLDALGRVQAGGETWMSGTTWDDRPAIRFSVSSWRTTEEDIERTVAAYRAALGQAAAR